MIITVIALIADIDHEGHRHAYYRY